MSLAGMIARLSEMFPKQDYQSRLENYLKVKNPKSQADIEHWMKEYDRNTTAKSGVFQ